MPSCGVGARATPARRGRCTTKTSFSTGRRSANPAGRQDGLLPIPDFGGQRDAQAQSSRRHRLHDQPQLVSFARHPRLDDQALGGRVTIVGQKEIDQALGRPEDRRAWVDEAAGVQRYRSRKLDSLKRLSAATGHLERVNDILHEIETQREPLREASEDALKYKTALEPSGKSSWFRPLRRWRARFATSPLKRSPFKRR